jgi:hypothetical protein
MIPLKVRFYLRYTGSAPRVREQLFKGNGKEVYAGSSTTTTERSSAGALMGTMVSMSVWTLSHC